MNHIMGIDKVKGKDRRRILEKVEEGSQFHEPVRNALFCIGEGTRAMLPPSCEGKRDDLGGRNPSAGSAGKSQERGEKAKLGEERIPRRRRLPRESQPP